MLKIQFLIMGGGADNRIFIDDEEIKGNEVFTEYDNLIEVTVKSPGCVPYHSFIKVYKDDLLLPIALFPMQRFHEFYTNKPLKSRLLCRSYSELSPVA